MMPFSHNALNQLEMRGKICTSFIKSMFKVVAKCTNAILEVLSVLLARLGDDEV